VNAPDPRVSVDGHHGQKTLCLWDYLAPADAERAEVEANAWIKSLRHAEVDGLPFRVRFTHNGDSLWWFAELYLHKQGTMASALRAVAALEALIDRERPTAIDLSDAGPLATSIGVAAARRAGVACRLAEDPASALRRARRRVLARSWLYRAEAEAARVRASVRPRPGPPGRSPVVAAFVHSAFWRPAPGAGDIGEERYVGPVLDALAKRLAPGELQLVGLGPRTSFRARRWWHRAKEFPQAPDPSAGFASIDAFAPAGGPAGSDALWRDRRSNGRALDGSDDLRRRSVVRGYDLWPFAREDLAGIAWLQFPWSARAMDQAGVALETLRPAVVVTYAEAGGWGRALALEARRRAIPVIGLQHGFIYRHWLNYLHEPDEMAPAGAHDSGFPRPDVTLVFDEHAAAHLRSAGRFPCDAVEVTGSPRLDALVASVERLGRDDIAAARAAAGVGPGEHLVLLASKFTQVRTMLGALVHAISGFADARLVIKCHPAESPDPYVRAVEGHPRATVLPGRTDLAALVAAARLIVTVNSTVAVDAMVLGVPSLAVALPNNLSPFVEGGAMAGAATVSEVAPALRALLYDEDHRARLAARSREFAARHRIGSDGRAAERAADAILRAVGRVKG
jgi:hypothetical protein